MKVREIITESYLQEGPSSLLKGIFKGGSKSAKKPAAKGSGKSSKISSKAVLGHVFGNASDYVVWLFGAYEAGRFATRVYELKKQRELAEKGDKTTKIFSDSLPNDFDSIYKSTLDTYAGEAVIGALPVLLKAPAKAFDFMSRILGFTGKVAGGAGGAMLGYSFGGISGGYAGAALGSALGKTIIIPVELAGMVTKLLSGGIGGAAFVAWVNSPYGKEFFKNAMEGSLVQVVGGIATGYFDKGLSALKGFLSTAKEVIKTGKLPSSKDEKGGEDKKPSTSIFSNNLPPELKKIEQQYNSQPLLITFDRNNPKIMYLNGRKVTDSSGYLAVSSQTLQQVEQWAKTLNKPNPLTNIPLNPDPSKRLW